MEKVQDYYVYLGLPESASSDEIRRVIIRMRRNSQEDVEKYSLLQEIQDTLCDASKRKQYDIKLQYGNQIDHIKEKIHNSETEGEIEKNLKEARKLYTKVLQSDANNVEVLWELVGIEELLKNENQAVTYLMRLEKITEGEAKLEVLHRLGELYKKQGKKEEAIRCFDAIYKADTAYVEDVWALVRLYYEDKSNIKEAIQILNDCINRCEDSCLKITYLCETLRAILFQGNEKYKKIEEVIYKKLEGFHYDNKEKNLASAEALLVAIAQLNDEGIKDKAWFHRFEQIYLSYAIENEELNNKFEMIRQAIKLEEDDKIHEAIELYMEDVWMDDLREKLSKMIAEDAAGIAESLHYIKEAAPLFWNTASRLEDFEKIVMDNLPYSNELKEIKKDTRIVLDLRMMLELFMVNIFVDFDKIKPQLCKARDNFFNDEDKAKVQYSLKRLEEYYPASYQRIADIFYEGKSTEEVFQNTASKGENNQKKSNVYFPNAADDYIYKPYLAGFWELLLIVIVTCCLPPILPIIFLVKYYHRHKKKMDKFLKVILILVVIAAIAGGVVLIKNFINDKQQKAYEESHDGWLDEKELKKVEKLSEKYDAKVPVDIRYIQRKEGSADTQTEYDGSFIYLVYSSMGLSFQMGSHSLYSNCFTNIQSEKLSAEIGLIFDEELTDYEEVEKFYEIAYKYAKEVDEMNLSDQDTSMDMESKNDNQNSESSGEKQNSTAETYEDFFDEITTQNTNLDKKIAEQYAVILSDAKDGILPYGKSFEKSGSIGDKYAIHDIDADGNQELIVSISDTYTAAMLELVYEYDGKTETLIEQFQGFPSCTYYENGVIKEEWSHNQGYGTTIWPYNLYEYVGNNEYRYILSIDSWDKSAHPYDYEGNAFPSEKDTDGNGTVFLIQNSTGNYLCDVEEYAMTLKNILGGAVPIYLNWVTY